MLRFAILTAAMFLGLLRLGAALHRMQMRESGDYAREQIRHSIRRVRLPATRGRILDRNGAILADNKPSFAIAVYVEELRSPGNWSNTVDRVDTLLDTLAGIIGRERDTTRNDIGIHVQRRRAIPLLVFHGLSPAELARYAEASVPPAKDEIERGDTRLLGTGIYFGTERVYPNADLAAHIIGYTGRDFSKNNADPAQANHGTRSQTDADYENWDTIDGDEHTREIDFYLPDLTGREGIEKYLDAKLAGTGGGKLIRVDAIGYRHNDNITKDPVPGKDVTLTLDLDLQRTAEEALGERRGAAIVIDLRNGDILAAAAAPRYDLAKCSPRFPADYFAALNSDPDKPLLNRAFSGIYPPGSVLKPVVALTAISQGKADEYEAIHCPGYYKLGNRTIQCTSKTHGHLQMREALARSCNPYFITLGIRLGWEPELRADCERLGFGKAPAIGIPVGSGFLPSAEEKRRRQREGWTAGDTANLSIGQGSITATPLQIALMTCAIALDGKTLKPRLIRDDGDGVRDQPEYGAEAGWPKHGVATVKTGMHDAVNTPYGTARRIKIDGIDAAAKTGTAEYTPRDPVTKELLHKKHAWIICYAPAAAPRYAFAVVAEDSDFGGTTAAEILRPILEKTMAAE